MSVPAAPKYWRLHKEPRAQLSMVMTIFPLLAPWCSAGFIICGPDHLDLQDAVLPHGDAGVGVHLAEAVHIDFQVRFSNHPRVVQDFLHALVIPSAARPNFHAGSLATPLEKADGCREEHFGALAPRVLVELHRLLLLDWCEATWGCRQDARDVHVHNVRCWGV